LKEMDYNRYERIGNTEVYCFDDILRSCDLYARNNHFSGAVVVIGKTGYEFIRQAAYRNEKDVWICK
jgi:hypothetical protein